LRSPGTFERRDTQEVQQTQNVPRGGEPAVGELYDTFDPVEDEEVARMLREAALVAKTAAE
jgi:hypothetical protein